MTEPRRSGHAGLAERDDSPVRADSASGGTGASVPLPDGAARPDERTPRYCSVRCDVCGAVVRAAKFSLQHTSVQWDAAAVRQCAEFARRVAAGDQTPLIERCEAMRASIDTAAREGRLPVEPP